MVGDDTKFNRPFVCEDGVAHQPHGQSDAVRTFESVYCPVLVGGPVALTDYNIVAANQ